MTAVHAPAAGSTAGTATIELRADTLTPVAAALRLRDRLAFLLESVEGGARYGRYSILGVRGRTLTYDDGEALVRETDESESLRFEAPDPLEAVRAVLPAVSETQHRGDLPPETAFPFSLSAGVGYLGYEVAARWERLPVPDPDPVGLPEAFFHLPDVVIVFDHLAQVARMATVGGADASARLAAVQALLCQPSEGELPLPVGAHHPPYLQDEEGARRYQERVARLVDDIHAGEMLQAVLARRFTLHTSRHPFDVYRSLRRINPSPHLYYLDLGDGDALLGASPELLVRARAGTIVTRPIAGTRPRSADPVLDAALEDELRRDDKELAEHAMLVDLARNDVGRVAEPGSVEVPVMLSVERYSHVMHLVSEVRGRLREGYDAFDAVRSTFPAGTLTGAPKVRAMQGVAELEGERRGPYGGVVGVFAPDDVEAAITIRSVVVRGGSAYVHAGAGIVADSDPEREAAEVAAKAGAVLAALAEEGGA